MLKITLTDEEVEALKQGETVQTPITNAYGSLKLRMLKKSECKHWDMIKYDPSVDLIITPHDLWDIQMDGGLLIDDRPVHIHISARRLGPDIMMYYSDAYDEKWPPEDTKPQKGKRKNKRKHK